MLKIKYLIFLTLFCIPHILNNFIKFSDSFTIFVGTPDSLLTWSKKPIVNKTCLLLTSSNFQLSKWIHLRIPYLTTSFWRIRISFFFLLRALTLNKWWHIWRFLIVITTINWYKRTFIKYCPEIRLNPTCCL